MDPLNIWQNWEYLWQIVRVRDYMANSYLFALYEGPVMTVAYGGWPWLHLALAALYYLMLLRLGSTSDAYVKYHGGDKDILTYMYWLPLILVPYLFVATVGGARLATYKEIGRANPTLIPMTLPPRPAVLPQAQWGRIYERNSPYVVPRHRAEPTYEMNLAARYLRTFLDFFILFTPLPLLFIWGLAALFPRVLFSFAYAREMRRPHLPTEIVNRALSGGHIDNTALANVLTQSTAPVVRDSLADKIERERLTALANRLQSDTTALNDKLSKETEIARLVVSHARKREELADMENKLRDMGVKRDG